MGRCLVAGVVVLAMASVAEACWWSWTPTGYVCTPCPTPTAGCPTPTTLQRCYYEPRTSYQTVTQVVPTVSWVSTCYVDPLFGTVWPVWLPTVSLVEQQWQVPVTTYERRCETVAPAGGQRGPAPEVETLPEASTERRYYYAPEVQEEAEKDGAEGSREQLPPPPAPDEQQPEARQSVRGAVKVVEVQWRPVRREKRVAQK